MTSLGSHASKKPRNSLTNFFNVLIFSGLQTLRFFNSHQIKVSSIKVTFQTIVHHLCTYDLQLFCLLESFLRLSRITVLLYIDSLILYPQNYSVR